MAKIPVGGLIDQFEKMTAENWPYKSPGSNDRNGIDCSGAFVYAYKQYGKSIYHGSNRIARTEVGELLPISSAQPGMAAFKHRKPGADYYALPDGYKPGGKYYNGDMNDYYHIGLVGRDGKILNARNEKDGFVASPVSQGWSHVAYLNQVEYENAESEEPEMADTAIVRASSGSTVKMRGKPDTGYNLYWDVPIGSTVTVLARNNPEGWSRVSWNGRAGYMMNNFLDFAEGDVVVDDGAVPGVVRLELDKATASALMQALRKAGVE